MRYVNKSGKGNWEKAFLAETEHTATRKISPLKGILEIKLCPDLLGVIKQTLLWENEIMKAKSCFLTKDYSLLIV